MITNKHRVRKNHGNFTLIILLGCFATNISLFSKDIYIPSLPAIADSMHGTAAYASQSITLFLLGAGLSQLVFGPLSDRVGRRITILSGLMICFLGNTLSIFASSMDIFLLCRLMAGIGAGACIVIPRAMASDMFSDSSLTKAVSFLSMSTVVSPALAPFLGGIIQQLYDWHGSFVFLSIMTFSCFLLFALYFRETNTRVNAAPFSIRVVVMHNLEMLASREFLVYTALSIIAFATGMIYLILSPFIFQNDLGITPAQNGLLYIFIAIGYFIGALSTTRLASFMPDDSIIFFGLSVCLLSILCLLASYTFAGPAVIPIVTTMAFFAVGGGLITPVANKQCIARFPGLSGTAAALVGFLRLLGGFIIGLLISSMNTYNTLMLGVSLLILTVCGLIIHLRMQCNTATIRRHLSLMSFDPHAEKNNGVSE